MATTRIISMHVNQGKTIADCLTDRIDYSKNPDKTQGGELISAYQCDPKTADAEFLLSKRQYKTLTGREQQSDVIAYQVRQSFKPGEITPEEANRVGYEFAERFLKGRHAFFVATHTDKKHIHNHIIWNSTTLDCKHKFRDFLGSGRAVARLSDVICTEHRLSVIADPKRGVNHYGRWLGNKAKPSHRELLCGLIDAALLQKPDSFDTLLKLLAEAGCEVRRRGDTLSLRHPNRKGFIRLSSIENYTEGALRAVLAGEKEHTPRRKRAQVTRKKDALLIDIEAKLQAGKGMGYERWAKVFNVKQMAQTYNYLREHGLLDYEELEARASAATERYHTLSAQIKAAEGRMAEIAVLKTHIANYAKTRDVYAGYRKAGYSKKYLAEHEGDILLHKAAKKAFDELGVKKLPSVKSLQEEYAKLLPEKRRRMPNTGVRAMRCASCCSTSRTWIVCWAKTSARRRRKRSMTGNNGHAPKRFAETRSRASCAFKGVLGALPLTSRGEFSRRRKFPENAKEGPLCPACHVFSRPSQRCFLCFPA